MSAESEKCLGFCPDCAEKVFRHESDLMTNCSNCGHAIDWHDPSTWTRTYWSTRPGARQLAFGLFAVAVLMAFTAWFASPGMSYVIAAAAFGLTYIAVNTLLTTQGIARSKKQ